MREILVDVVGLLGFSTLVFGVGLASIPAAFIVGGSGLMAFAYIAAKPRKDPT